MRKYHQEELRQSKFDEGREEGQKEGKAAERQLIAAKMLRQGIAPELIAEATGFSADELAVLAEAMRRDPILQKRR